MRQCSFRAGALSRPTECTDLRTERGSAAASVHSGFVMAKSKKSAKSKEVPKKAQRRAPGAKALKGPISPQTDLAQLDRELLRIVQDRGKLVLQMAEQGRAPFGADIAVGLEDSQLACVLDRVEGPLSRRAIRAVFREVVSGCRSLVRQTRVALLGPQYSYSHLAALGHFGQGVEFVPVGTIPAVFEEVNRRHSDFGVVPIENSTDGRIADTLDMFTRLPVRICGQIEMKIHHTMLGKCRREEVTEVYSKPQALSQCRNWLAKHVPAARPIEVTSTSTAAQLAAEKPGAAAIASLQAGVHYGLDVLAECIEDNVANLTRFALIGDQSPLRTNNDKTALLFQTEHRFGALVDVLAVFKRFCLNLAWIESFPVPGPGRLYLFFVEVEGHETDDHMQKALKAIKEKTFRLEVLGSYPAPTPIDS